MGTKHSQNVRDVVSVRMFVPRTVPPGVSMLLRKADAELSEAANSISPGDRFVHAHLAAIRSAAAVVALRRRSSAHSGVRSVWDMLALAEPDLAPWSRYFASGAPLRAAVDAGRPEGVEPARADELLVCAEDFRDEAAMLVDPQAGFFVQQRRTVVFEAS